MVNKDVYINIRPPLTR